MKNTIGTRKNTKLSLVIKIAGGCAVAGILAFGILVLGRANGFSKNQEPINLNQTETTLLSEYIKTNYPQEDDILKPLPYKFNFPQLEIGAESAILINMDNGNIIYEKNADQVIPPASMTKLFAMYVVEEQVKKGLLSYDQIIPLPEESWACNMPPHSSLMFLGKDQVVTLEELLLGLCICSGNDAAYALAYTVCGNMEDFVALMNEEAKKIGLINTSFVESSGYSELNTTTAREMATFCRYYLTNHPESLKRFHSVPSFTYPKEKNIAPGDFLQAQDFTKGFPEKITMSITQKNTNPLLGKMEGCDGLKTGYIEESGYNLSLTAQRNGTRFLSVTMKGPGNSTWEGQQGRIKDGTALMDYAFYSFATYKSEKIKPYKIKTFASENYAINLVPAYFEDSICMPYITGSSMKENLEAVKVDVVIPEYIFGNIQCGTEYGKIIISLDNYLIKEIPLIADRTSPEKNIFVKFADKILTWWE